MTSELKQVVDGLSREANGAATEALLVAGSNALRGTGMLSRDDDALTHQVLPSRSPARWPCCASLRLHPGPPRRAQHGDPPSVCGEPPYIYIYIFYMRSRYACTGSRHVCMENCGVDTGRRHVYMGSRPFLNPCRAGGPVLYTLPSVLTCVVAVVQPEPSRRVEA